MNLRRVILSAAGLCFLCLVASFVTPAPARVLAAEKDKSEALDADIAPHAPAKKAASSGEGAGTGEGAATRLVMGMGSAEKVLDSLEYIVDKLAGKNHAWVNNVQPNLEIFLIGVATDLPIRFDMMMDPEHGGQMQTIVPISDLKEFLDDNLAPIDIIAERDRQDRNLYELSGTVYEGWLRYLPEPTPYGIFFPQKEALPKDMPHPELLHRDLAENVAFLLQKNTAEHAEDRIASFKKYRELTLKDLQKLSTESRDEFELRNKMREQLLSLLQQWFVESHEIKLGLKVDQDQGHAPIDLLFSALPETALLKELLVTREHASMFSAIEPPKASVLSARVNMGVGDARKAGYKEVFELTRPVMKEHISAETKPSDAEKAARIEMAMLMLDVLRDSMDQLPAVDMFVDIVPAKDLHTIVMGVALASPEKLTKILEKLPAAKEGWKIEMGAEKAGETPIHKLTFGEAIPKSLSSFYGDSGTVYFAVTDQAGWLAGGVDSLDALKSRLEKVAASKPGKSDGVLASLKMNVRPVLKNLYEIDNDPDLQMLKSLNFRGRIKNRAAERNAEGNKSGANENKPGRRATSGLAGFKWAETAIAAMEGTDDRFELSITVDEQGAALGHSDAQAGFLKALGAVIAKFSEENLK